MATPCNKCNETTITNHICDPKPCDNLAPCDCPTKLGTKCVTFEGDDLPCTGIKKGTILTAMWQQLDTYLCKLKTDLLATFDIVNIGALTNAKIYKGLNLLGKKELRSITKTGNLVTVTENTNDISLSIDTTALTTFVGTVDKTSSVSNLGTTGAKIYNEIPITVGNNTEYKIRRIKTDNSGLQGESILKTEIENTNDITISAKKINSNSLNIITSLDGNTLNINLADSGIPMFIVNSDYTGIIELGTQTKPFKNLQNALDAYVGNGVSNKAPEFLGVEVVIQKDINIFTGSLTYKGLKLKIQDNNTLITNPSVGNFVINLDSEAVLPSNSNYLMLPFSDTDEVSVTIDLGTNSFINCTKQFLKNRGSNSLVGNTYKIVSISGQKGGIRKYAETNVANPSISPLFSLNEDNRIGFLNPGNPQLSLNTNVISNNSQIAIIGQSANIFANNCNLRYGVNGIPFNSDTVPIEINGGTLSVNEAGGNVDFQNEFNNFPTYFLKDWITVKTQGGIGSQVKLLNCSLGRVTNSFIKNIDTGTTTSNVLILNKCYSINNLYDSFVKNVMSSNSWNIGINDCDLHFWNVASNVKINSSSINTLQQKIVETLPQYNSRADAIIAGLFLNCKFINTGGVISPTTDWFVDIVI